MRASEKHVATAALLSDVSIDGERMSNEEKNQAGKQPLIKLRAVTFDENGEIVGLDDDVLDHVSGGLANGEPQTQCDGTI